MQPPEADEAAGEGEECFVDLVAAVVADEQPLVVVEPGEGAFDDPADAAEPGAVFGLTAGDLGFDSAGAELAPVLVVVVAAVGGDAVGPSTRPADLAAHRRHAVDERHELGDVVAVAAGDRPGERDPAAVYEEVVLAPAAAAIDGAGTRFRAPFFACR